MERIVQQVNHLSLIRRVDDHLFHVKELVVVVDEVKSVEISASPAKDYHLVEHCFIVHRDALTLVESKVEDL